MSGLNDLIDKSENVNKSGLQCFVILNDIVQKKIVSLTRFQLLERKRIQIVLDRIWRKYLFLIH